MWDFVAQSEDELSVKAGEIIKIRREESGTTGDVWVTGRVGNREGKIPVTYLQPLSTSSHEINGSLAQL